MTATIPGRRRSWLGAGSVQAAIQVNSLHHHPTSAAILITSCCPLWDRISINYPPLVLLTHSSVRVAVVVVWITTAKAAPLLRPPNCSQYCCFGVWQESACWQPCVAHQYSLSMYIYIVYIILKSPFIEANELNNLQFKLSLELGSFILYIG